MKEIGNNRKEVAKENYRDWPLFKSIKKEAEFQSIFESIFSEPYNKVEPETLKLQPKISEDPDLPIKNQTENTNGR